MINYQLTSRQLALLIEAVDLRIADERAKLIDGAPRIAVKQDLSSMQELLARADEVIIQTV